MFSYTLLDISVDKLKETQLTQVRLVLNVRLMVEDQQPCFSKFVQTGERGKMLLNKTAKLPDVMLLHCSQE